MLREMKNNENNNNNNEMNNNKIKFLSSYLKESGI